MTGPSIRPIQFAHAIQYALAYRSNGSGMSTYEAARYALGEACGYHEGVQDWLPVLVGFLSASPSTAEAWAECQLTKTLSRAFGSSMEGEANAR
jgi:hypothetical protein